MLDIQNLPSDTDNDRSMQSIQNLLDHFPPPYPTKRLQRPAGKTSTRYCVMEAKILLNAVAMTDKTKAKKAARSDVMLAASDGSRREIATGCMNCVRKECKSTRSQLQNERIQKLRFHDVIHCPNRWTLRRRWTVAVQRWCMHAVVKRETGSGMYAHRRSAHLDRGIVYFQPWRVLKVVVLRGTEKHRPQATHRPPKTPEVETQAPMGFSIG